MPVRSLAIALFIAAILLYIIISGCAGDLDSGTQSPTLPSDSRFAGQTDRVLWGYYEISIDPVATKIEITPLRQISMHLNALQYLETPTTTLVTLEGPPQFGGGMVKVNIGLTHPYPPKIFTGFDVRGILITRGSLDFGGGYILPGQADFRLLNPDGYTRFWNPTEFAGTGYQDGILGAPHSIGKYDATVNGFKYFADGLGPDDDFTTFTSALRGAFKSGTKNIRHYEIKIGDYGLLFNYAVDASWAMPGNTPPTVPDDFDVDKANSKEAWKIVADYENLLSPGGGECFFTVDVYDWQGPSTINAVFIHAPGLFDGPMELTGPEDNGDYYTYSTVFINELGGVGDIPILIRVNDTASMTSPFIEAFQLTSLAIEEVVITLDDDAAYKTIGTDYHFGYDTYELSTTAAPVDYLDTDGPWDFTVFTGSMEEHTTIFGPDANEVSTFVFDFPAEVEYFLRELTDEEEIFTAEEHDEIDGALNMYGFYSYEDFGGSIVFNTPAAFTFPYNKDTDFAVHQEVPIIPTVLIIVFDYHITAVGQGWARAPYDNTWHNCLVVRRTLDLASAGTGGEGWAGTMMNVDWIADDGTIVARVLSENVKEEGFNFDPDTFEIFGYAEFGALTEITD